MAIQDYSVFITRFSEIRDWYATQKDADIELGEVYSYCGVAKALVEKIDYCDDLRKAVGLGYKSAQKLIDENCK